MERKSLTTPSRSRTRRSTASTPRGRRSPQPASRRRAAGVPHSPASAHAAFTAAFTEYWRAIQAEQSALLRRTQEAYTEFMHKLEEIWKEEPVQAMFAERCLAFAESVRQAGTGPEALSLLEAAYREYVERLRDAWNASDLQARIEELYLSVTETVQRATEGSQQKLEAARAAYLEQLCGVWAAVTPQQLDADALGRVSRNMMITVFFTEGMRPPDTVLPTPSFT